MFFWLLVDFFDSHSRNYPTPSNITYFWNFGSLAFFCLVIQLVTGLFLSMHYIASADLAFLSLEHIIRDVNYGWLLHYLHSNGASLFFFILYCHMGRALYYKSYLGQHYHVWASGVILFLLTMATAFFGYVLPWGQMSLWGATVITNLFSVVPVIGKSLVLWLWGGFSVESPTIGRFYSLHFILPFIIAAFSAVHVLLLHVVGSTSPLRGANADYSKFLFYYYWKDVFGCLCVFFIFSFIIIYVPNLLGHPDNYIEANPLVTPVHIVPEWYFLPFYAMLRSIPNKFFGVIIMFSALLILFVVPIYSSILSANTTQRRHYIHYSFNVSTSFSFLHVLRFWLLIGTFILLGWLGCQPAEEPYVSISLYLTAFYFFNITLLDTFCTYCDAHFISRSLGKNEQ
jgi:quinol-cytochrome oxidoreductase complex cytochrome b subunit